MDVGDLIRSARRELGFSQRKLAKAVGVSPGAVGQWESSNSTNKPSHENLIEVARVLQLSLNSLTQDGSTMPAFELTDPKEIALVTLYRAMTPRQKNTHLSLFYSTTGAAEPAHDKSSPSDDTGVSTVRPV
jgi:transcriptional regulator with XRE-family HTH domain